MPYLETPEELADHLADLFGVYGSHAQDESCPDDPRRKCRVCFAAWLADAIRQAVANEEILTAPGSQWRGSQ